MVNRIEEKKVNYEQARKNGKVTLKKKKDTLPSFMKLKQKNAKAAQKTAAETQEFLKWALQNCKNQGDLDAIRELVNTNGTAKQRQTFEKMEKDFASGLSKAQRRQELAKRTPNSKLAKNENFRQAILNTETFDDLKALEKEYGGKLPQSLRTTYNTRLNAMKNAASQQAAQHAQMQEAYNKLFGYGNGKHPSNTPFGTAKPTVSSGMTYARYAQEHGVSYTKPGISGVAKADYLAQEIIAQNKKHAQMQQVYEELFKGVAHKTPVVSIPMTAEPVLSVAPSVETRPTISEPPANKAPKGAKAKGYKIGKGGKFALAALALGLVAAGIGYLTGKKKAAPTTADGKPIKPGIIKPDTISAQKKDTLLVASTDTIEQKVVRQIPLDTKSGKYIVKKGDNCWNIAKAELIREKAGKMPTDAEIQQRTYKILERNDLNFEADKYTVLIYPNDTLNVKM